MIKSVPSSELTYQVISCCYETYNELGYGYQERYYYRLLRRKLVEMGFRVKEQLYVPIIVGGKVIGKYFLDFLIEDCLVLELKIAAYPHHQYIQQVLGYLVANRLRLGLLVLFTSRGVVVKRLIK